MSSHAGLILFIVGIFMTAFTVGIFIQVTSEPVQSDREFISVEPEINQVTAKQIENRKAETLTISVKGGSTPVQVEDTLITITTENGSRSYPVIIP